MYEVGDKIEATTPGDVTIVGKIMDGPHIESDGVWYNLEIMSDKKDDGQMWWVRQDEITVVLDTES